MPSNLLKTSVETLELNRVLSGCSNDPVARSLGID
jgi:hypothetical protein